jgi:predicted lipoprotein with Yx(FWY)xxD motif
MRRIVAGLGILGLALSVSTGLVWSQAMSTVQVATAPDGVKYLVDGAGMTLYYFTLDTNGQSACSGGCVDKWPLYYVSTPAVAAPLAASDFGTITRPDGAKQTTYKGWPLYYWYLDKNPGEMKGEGVGKVWYILKVPAYTVMIGTNKAVGNYLVDGNGSSLYYFTKDPVGQSACNGDCIKNWPAFTVSSLVVPSALNPADFATITRSDGTQQITFKGYPLYYWVKDAARGDLTGQGVGKVWYAVDPAKFPPAPAAGG